MRRFTTLMLAATMAVFGLAGCGDDGDDTATTTTTTTEQPDEAAAYCEKSAAIDEGEGPPGEDQIRELIEVAPPEIRPDVELFGERFIEEGVNAFGDPEIEQAVERVEEWEKENCPGAAERQEEDDEEEAQPQTPDPDATQVAVTARDFEFQISGEVPAGKVAFVMTNEGDTPHEMGLVKFKEGTTVQQAEQSLEDGTVFELVDEELGESSVAQPGEEAVLNAELSPGVYGMACFVDEPDGVEHFFKGMRTVFEVS